MSNSMTLNDPERQNRGFIDSLAILGCGTSLYHSQVAPRYYRYAIQIENLVFVY